MNQSECTALIMHAFIVKLRQSRPDYDLLMSAANILVRYLGEEGPSTPISAAVSMCNPFNLVSHFQDQISCNIWVCLTLPHQ